MIKTNSLTVNEIKKCSQKVRQYFHIKDGNCFPIYDVLLMLYDNEEIGIQILDDTDMQLPKDAPSEYDVKENFIYVKESVLKKLEENNYRNNFTLCHEFFHFLQCKVLNFKFEEVETCPAYCDVEWQANEFADQLLILEEMLRFDAKFLAKKYHTTIECALYRKYKYKKRYTLI
ncbi:MAG: hypothetical protein H6690_03160 [Erysipelotrichaceae bacterium]|nr:hypothetical protein [Erysipelotrichaceae bacterium]